MIREGIRNKQVQKLCRRMFDPVVVLFEDRDVVLRPTDLSLMHLLSV
jgi:hypothetical protein